MEAVQRLVRSLKTARSYGLPQEPEAAYFMLLSNIMQKQHRPFIELLETGNQFDVNFASGKSKRTLLHMAANVGAFECMWHLLKKGAHPNMQDRQGITPLQVASRNGFLRCITKLLEFGADIGIQNNEGMTAIHWLASNGRTGIFAEITKFIKDIDIKDANHQTPLHVACLNGHLNTVSKLIELKAEVDKRNIEHCTPLFFACSHGHAEVAKLLLDHGASLLPNCHGVTPLQAAVQAGFGKVCYMLIESLNDTSLLVEIVTSASTYNVDPEMIKKVLLYFLDYPHYRNYMLQSVANQVRLEGLQLLSPSCDYELTVARFLRVIELFISLLVYEPSWETKDKGLDRSWSIHKRADSMSSQISPKKSPASLIPDNLPDIQTELNSLWETLETWMKILQAELKPKDIEVKLEELRIADQRNSANIDMLIQPAHEVSGWVPNLLRSDSYHTAVTSRDSITYMHSSSVDSALVQPLNLPAQPSSSSEPNIISATTSPRDQAVQSPVAEEIQGKERQERDVVSLTADRLCGIVHGYYLFCQSNPSWNIDNGNMWQFDRFVEKHEPVLQLLVSRNSKLIFDHFHFVLDNPLLLQRFLPAIHSQPFTERQGWFYENLHDSRRTVVFDDSAVIHVTRDQLLETSCLQMEEKSEEHLKMNVSVRFQGEEGMGAGVTREWIQLLVSEILNPDCALFTLSADGSTFQPNSHSAINPDHLNYFQFAGRIMGVALYHRHFIPAYFSRSFYKHMLGIPVNYKDVKSLDPEYSKNLQWILDNDISDLGLEIPFSVETDVFGEMQEVELKPDGKKIPVSEENKFEYVQLAADLRMTKAIHAQIYAFLKGFYQFIPHHLVALFNEYELELLLSGLPDIDVQDWKTNTSLQAGFTSESPVVQWFWELVEGFDKEEQAQLLQFVTGTSRVPWGGFSNLAGATGNQLFTICKSTSSDQSLPTASTCFNMLKLPDYKSKEDLEKFLKIAITHGTVGFEFT